MKKNLLLLACITLFVIIGISAFKNNNNLANNGEDADFYADEQLAAQSGCTVFPVISNVQVTSVTSNSALATWTTDIPANSMGKVWVSPATAGTTPWLPKLETGGVTTHSYLFTGLSQNTQHYYRIRSESVPGGCRKTSSTYTFTTLASGGTTAPATPTGLSASNVSCSSLTLNWTASTGSPTGYEVYGPNTACNVNASAGYCGSTTGATSLNITGLSPSTTYSGSTGGTAGFTVLAFNSYGYSSAAPRLSVATPTCQGADTIAPVTTTSNPSSSWANTNVSRVLTCTDNPGGSGCASTWWKFLPVGSTCDDGGYTSGTTATYTPEGQWRLCFFSVDNANNNESIGPGGVKYAEPFKIDRTAPAGTLTTPTSGATISGTYTLTASVNDTLSGIANVTFKVDGITVGNDGTGPAYTYAWNTTSVSNGSHTMTVVVTDVAGNIYTTPVTNFSVNNVVANQAPTATITSPTSSATYATSTNSITLGGTATDDSAVSSVTWANQTTGTSGTATGTTSWTINTIALASGSNTIIVTSHDIPGLTGTDTITVTYTPANTAPTATITSPTSAATYTAVSSTVALGGTATDNAAVTSVTWVNQANGTSGTATGTSSWSIATITLINGLNTIVVTANDAGGLTGTDTIAVTYTAPPTISNVTATNITTSGATITWTTNITSDTQVYYGTTTAYGSQSALNTSPVTVHSVTLSGLSAGTLYHYQARSSGAVSSDMTFTTLSANYSWSGGAGLDIGGALTPSNYEPSGLAWSSGSIYSISDGSTLTKLSPTGTIQNTWTIPGGPDTEAVAVTNVNSYVYISYENGAGGGAGNPEIREFNPATGTLTGKYWILSGMTVASNQGMEGFTWVPNGHSPYTGTSGGVFYVATENASATVYVFNVNLSAAPGTTVTPITSFVAATDGRYINDLWYASDSRTLYILSNGANKLKAFNIASAVPTTISDQTIPAEGVTQEGFTLEPSCPTTTTTAYIAEDTGGTGHVIHKYTNFPVVCNGADTTAPIISNVSITSITQTTATVNWTTNEAANSAVDYGIGNYNSTTSNPIYSTAHAVTLSGLTAGSVYQYKIRSSDASGNQATHNGVSTFTTSPGGADPYIVVAGDISISGGGQMQTSDYIINSLSAAAAVLTVGDNAYANGTLAEYNANYDPSWGRASLISKSRPSPGNHEYYTTNAADYFSYFQGKGVNVGTSGQGWYSYNVGNWHIVALNTNSGCTTVSCAAGSAQEQWLRSDLAANPTSCSLAYWHHPRFTSGTGHSSSTVVQPLWKAFQDYGGDVVVGGHVHNYERFAPQTSSGTGAGTLDNTNGIRSFVVGTGGTTNFYSSGTPIANSVYQIASTWGVLKLTLHPSTYDWQFIRTSDGTVMDSGTGTCH